MCRVPQSKIARNTFLSRRFLPPTPERLRLQARLIREAIAARHVEYLRFIRTKQAEVRHAQLLMIRPAEPLCLKPQHWVVPTQSPRRGQQYTRHNCASGEDDDVAR
jgi:hypothetical protein